MIEATLKLKVQKAINDSQQNLMQELTSMRQKISQQTFVSNDERFQKLHNSVQRVKCQNFKRKAKAMKDKLKFIPKSY